MIVGMNPYVVTNGNGQEAVKFYQEALEAEVVMMQTFGDLPPNPEYTPPEDRKHLVLHAHLKVGDFSIMLSDENPDNKGYSIGSQLTLALHIDDTEQTKKIYAKLQEGGQTIMELQETFWSPLYGIVIDKFGISWQLSTTKIES